MVKTYDHRGNATSGMAFDLGRQHAEQRRVNPDFYPRHTASWYAYQNGVSSVPYQSNETVERDGAWHNPNA